ncbi:MAG: ATP-dependent Clp protease proteolytic subunit [Acidimicrobiia bacterium]
MTIQPEHPEIPYPLPPERTPPQRTEPVIVPMVSIGGGDPWQHLTDQRRILVSGPLDRDTVTELSAALMALDGESVRDVEIVINSSGGPLAEIFPVLDVLGLMRARTNTTCVGSAVGTAVALVAAGTGTRRSASNATFCLRIDDRQTIDGTTSEIVRCAEELEALRDRYVATLASRTGLDEERLTAEIEHGRSLTATDARELGIVDAVDDRASNTNRTTGST